MNICLRTPEYRHVSRNMGQFNNRANQSNLQAFELFRVDAKQFFYKHKTIFNSFLRYCGFLKSRIITEETISEDGLIKRRIEKCGENIRSVTVIKYDKDGKPIECSAYRKKNLEQRFNYNKNLAYVYNTRSPHTRSQHPKVSTFDVIELDPNKVYFSQRTIGSRYKKIAKSLTDNGWEGGPIDIVETEKGKYVTMDNCRLAAAKSTNKHIYAIIHSVDEPVLNTLQYRFRIQHPYTKETIACPSTWGEIVTNRLYISSMFKRNKIDYSKAEKFPTKITFLKQFIRHMKMLKLYKKYE